MPIAARCIISATGILQQLYFEGANSSIKNLLFLYYTATAKIPDRSYTKSYISKYKNFRLFTYGLASHMYFYFSMLGNIYISNKLSQFLQPAGHDQVLR
jgi:hypothetical protein